MGQTEVQLRGRTVSIERFWSSNTYAGILEGNPKLIQERVRATLGERFARLCGDSQPLVWLDPPPGDVPGYLCAVDLKSLRSPARGHAGDVSFLTVGWCIDSLDVPISEMTRIALEPVDWDRHARSMTWDEYW